MYLAPAKVSGYEVCPMRSTGCTAACLNTAGRGQMDMVQQARINKTRMYFEDRPGFMLQLEKEIEAFIKKANKLEMIPVVRLNGTSDIIWERVPFVGAGGKRHKNMMVRFPDHTFYDYTKHHKRKNLPKNYTLTYSLAEDNDDRAYQALVNKINVAVVFRTPDFPKSFWGREVYDGDDTDLRFLDPQGGIIIGLKAKGKAKKDTTGFVRESHDQIYLKVVA